MLGLSGQLWAQAIESNDDRMKALTELALGLPKSLLMQVFEAVRAIGDEYLEAEALANLTLQMLESSHPQEVLKAVRAIQDNCVRVEALLKIVPQLDQQLKDEVLSEALETARRIDIGYYRKKGNGPVESRATALAEVASKLAEPLKQNVFIEAAGSELIRRERHGEALARLSTRLAESGYAQQALEITRMILDESWQGQALIEVVPHLPKPLLQEVLEAAIALRDEAYRARCLAYLSPHLPGHLLQEVLQAAQAIQNDFDWVVVLTQIAPHLGEPQKTEVLKSCLETLRAIERGRHWIQMLTWLAPHLPEHKNDLLKEGLEIAWAMDDKQRAESLVDLSHYLEEPLIYEALEMAKAIHDAHCQAIALANLAPRLAELSNPGQALAEVRAIKDDSWRAMALITLIAHLADRWLKDALKIVTEIKSGSLTRDDSLIQTYPRHSKQESLVSWKAQSIALGYLAPYLTSESRTDLYRIFRGMLHELTASQRGVLLTHIAVLSSVVRLVGGGEAVAETIRAIQDVRRWWP